MNDHPSPLHYKELWISAMSQHVSTEDPEPIIARSQNLTYDILLDRFLTYTTKNNQRTGIFLRHHFVKNMYHVFFLNRNKKNSTKPDVRLSIRVGRGWLKPSDSEVHLECSGFIARAGERSDSLERRVLGFFP